MVAMTTNEFQLHIDPSLYGFKFTGANYATVRYVTDRVANNISVDVIEIGIGPVLLIAITDRERLVREIEAAAKNNAEEYWANHATETVQKIVRLFAPHI